MTRNVLRYLIICVALMFVGVLVVAFLTGGLDRDLKARARAEIANLQDATASVERSKAQVQAWVDADKELFQARELDSKWAQLYESIQGQLEQASTQDVSTLEQLLAQNDAESAAEVSSLVDKISTLRLSALEGSSAIRSAAEQLVEFKQQISDKLPQMESDAEAIAQFDMASVRAVADRAISDWPQKKDDLEQRLKSLSSLQQSAASIWESTTAARGRVGEKQYEAADVNSLIEAANRLAQAKVTLLGSPSTLDARVDELYWSWDKVLADMEIVEGSQVQFRQSFKTTKMRALAAEGETAETKVLPIEQRTVDKAMFESMKNQLGMVVEHKSAGDYNSEAARVVQPPGYAYIAPPQQQRNQYGYWDRRGGSSFWVFYGQYSLLRDLTGGGRYGRVSPSMYGDYYHHRQAGRPYYGSTSQGRQLYGTGGAVTRTRYANSQYVRTNGFKNSNYVRSGGTYRGSAYARKSSSSYAKSPYRSRSSSSRSSRSYSSRSSGSRSGGFGGK